MIKTDRPILVTGAAGFIGSKVVEFLLESGQSVVGVDNLNDYYDIRLKNYRINSLLGQAEPHQAVALSGDSERLAKAELSNESLSFYQADVEDKESVDTLFGIHEFKSVLNLAARAGVRYSMENPHVYMTTNAIGTLNLLEGMRSNGVKKMVLASTSSLYAGQEMPFVETLPVNTPISPYAASKKSAEVMAYSYHSLYNLDISVMRYFTVFGPCGRPDMCMFRFAEWIEKGEPIELFGDGEQSRDFTYVDDIARGTIAAQMELGYEVINLGGGKNPVSINQVIEQIETGLEKIGKVERKPFHKADMMTTWADISKAKDLLDWEPEISVGEGIQKTVEWHKANRSWLNDILL
jgi:nucleoside-diphosphate-sugar epimerase